MKVFSKLEERILDSIETFYYLKKFNKSLFLLVLHDFEELEKLMLDLKVLSISGIKVVLLVASDPDLEIKIKYAADIGYPFTLRPCNNQDLHAGKLSKTINEITESGKLPILALETTTLSDTNLESFALDSAKMLEASKVYYLGYETAFENMAKITRHFSLGNINEIIESSTIPGSLNLILKKISAEKLLEFCDVAFLPAKQGSLYEEIFTHQGSGILFSSSYLNEIRQAKVEEVAPIALMMRPHFHSQDILFLDEEEILKDISSYLVYTVNSEVVACVKYTDYGEMVELGKLCTLPRFKGGGRAKKLVEKILDRARCEHKKAVFSATINEIACTFFLSLGFKETKYNDLPKAWLANYNQERGSRVFIYSIDSH